MRIPATRFLGHSLIYIDGETQAEKASRRFPTLRQEYMETLMYFPPTRVSILEFEETMRDIHRERAADEK